MRFIKKYINRETGSYLAFGVLTTLVNFVVFQQSYRLLGDGQALWANTIAFVAAVLFAFVTNKLFVFESRSWRWTVVRRELPAFFAGRIASFLVEQMGMYLAERVLNLGRYSLWGIDGIMLAKAALAVIVVVLNYIFGKLIFKRRQ